MKPAAKNKKNKQKTASNIWLVNRGKQKLRRGLGAANNYFQAMTTRRVRVAQVLLRQNHPVIATRLLLPGLFIGLMASVAFVISYDHSRYPAHALVSAANLWVDTSGGSCARQVSAGSYDDATACSSMQAAMTAAQAGDTVIVKCGSYPSQTISTGTKSGVVTFYAEAYDQAVTAADAYSATSCATVASLSLDGVDKVHIYGIQATPAPDNSRSDAHLTYAHGGSLSICDSGCSTATTDILVDGYHGRSFFGRVTNVVIDHSSFGGWDSCYDTAGNHLASGDPGTEDGFRFWTGTGGSSTPTNSVLRNSVIHDIIMGVNDSELASVCTYGSTNGPHSDCMQNNGGAGIVIENNIFFNCPSSDIQWNPFSGASIGTQTIQNNYFGPIGGVGNGTALGAQAGSSFDCTNIVVRNNFYNEVGINFHTEGCAGGVGGQIYGNIANFDCWSDQGATYHDNAFSNASATCGTNVKVCTPTFVVAPPSTPDWLATSTPDFHLADTDTCAKDSDSATYPSTDFEGDARPQGVAADLGPDEYMAPAASLANVFVTPSGNDATCLRGDPAKPCASLNGAYANAQAGDIIAVACGVYGAQTISERSIGTSIVTIEKDPSDNSCSKVTTGAITINTNYIKVDGFNVGNNTITAPPTGSGSSCTRHDITIANNIAAGTAAGIIAGCDHIFITGNDVSGTNQCVGGTEDSMQVIGFGNWGDYIPSNITISDNYIHDMAAAEGQCGAHADGLQTAGCQHCVIDGNRWNNTDTSFIIMYAPTSGQAADVEDITVENNSFGTVTEPGHGVSIGGQGCTTSSNVIIQNNTFLSNDTLDVNCSQSTAAAIVRNNIFIAGDQYSICSAYPYDMDYNIFSSITGCGTHFKNCTPLFGDPSHSEGNIDLSTSDTCARDYIPATAGTYPATDIYGTTRPQAGLVDAGAYEYTSGGGGADTTAPSVPSNLHAVATTTSSISLAWNAASDNVGGSGLAGYDLYRNGSYLTTVAGTSYTNTGLSAATTYSYQVRAVDNASNASSLSSALNAATQASSSPPASYKKGDCNHDNAVNIYDLSILLSHYNSNYSNADFDSNSIVNVIDLSILLSNYGG